MKNENQERRPQPGTPFMKSKVFFRLYSERYGHRQLEVGITANDAHPPYDVLDSRTFYSDHWVNATAGEVFHRQNLAVQCAEKVAERMGKGITKWIYYRRAGRTAWVRGMAANQHETELVSRLLDEFARRVKECMKQTEAHELEQIVMGDDD